MDDSLYIDLAQSQFQPRQRLSGTILWALTAAPKEISLVLTWSTEGRGSCDRKLEAELTWKTEATSGEEPFEFTLPASPYSFDAQLISLQWELQLSLKKGKATHHLPIVVSPHAQAVVLSPVSNESQRKSLSFLKP